MSAPSPSPVLAAFQRELARHSDLDFAEVRVATLKREFELRHVADAGRDRAELRQLTVGDLRQLAQTTVSGAFRPIKTAPNLRRDWWCSVNQASDLEEALEALYPGALTDWWAASQGEPPVQHYREFTTRQTGMYRITQQLTDAEAAALIHAGCDSQFCLRRRHWTVAGLRPDGPDDAKSVIPCLEPCPLMLEFARRGRRLLQAAPISVPLGPDELATVVQALDLALRQPSPEVREGDLAHPSNTRRIRLLRDRLQGLLPAHTGNEAEE